MILSLLKLLFWDFMVFVENPFSRGVMEAVLKGLPEALRLQQELKKRYGYHALSIRGSTEQAYRV
ncbi:TPA: hypothetical protein I7750_09650 [Vibrio vulnificus]|nr:hypothetical protein CRN60_08005 [Vibrio vulnificus]RZP81126.1 hypothetical protein D8T60_04385 [Vibrio vulnificus]RZQ39170.1 hypothetical protein D8T38_01155 [Vibrio vulnificus]RZQ79391.1 hypothetical protein D8T22_05165 [Vibrio vulnificus]RZR18408.1 hypothetical protein D8T44_01050 [Vibrio vulnificus]